MLCLKRTTPAGEEELLTLVHAQQLIRHVREKSQTGPCIIADFDEAPDNVTYVTASSYRDAKSVSALYLWCAEYLSVVTGFRRQTGKYLHTSSGKRDTHSVMQAMQPLSRSDALHVGRRCGPRDCGRRGGVRGSRREATAARLRPHQAARAPRQQGEADGLLPVQQHCAGCALRAAAAWAAQGKAAPIR